MQNYRHLQRQHVATRSASDAPLVRYRAHAAVRESGGHHRGGLTSDLERAELEVEVQGLLEVARLRREAPVLLHVVREREVPVRRGTLREEPEDGNIHFQNQEGRGWYNFIRS